MSFISDTSFWWSWRHSLWISDSDRRYKQKGCFLSPTDCQSAFWREVLQLFAGTFMQFITVWWKLSHQLLSCVFGMPHGKNTTRVSPNVKPVTFCFSKQCNVGIAVFTENVASWEFEVKIFLGIFLKVTGQSTKVLHTSVCISISVGICTIWRMHLQDIMQPSLLFACSLLLHFGLKAKSQKV